MKMHSGRPKAWKLQAAQAALNECSPEIALKHLSRSCFGAGYSEEYFELLGRALLGVGELVNAGRFLFVSGRRRAEYSDAIQCFLARHHNKRDFRQLQSQLPLRARVFWRLSQFPQTVAADLRALGWPEDIQPTIAADKSPSK